MGNVMCFQYSDLNRFDSLHQLEKRIWIFQGTKTEGASMSNEVRRTGKVS